MDFNEGMEQLSHLCKGKDWFYDIDTDSHGRYVVYIRFANHETITGIPDEVAGRQVLVHYASSITATRDSFSNNLSSTTTPWIEIKCQLSPESQVRVNEAVNKELDIIEEAVGPVSDEQSMRHLQNELERLEKVCGSFTLQDIFYEVQDGKNAVTNMSARYPEVRQSMEKLFEEYGFDIIYEELDG